MSNEKFEDKLRTICTEDINIPQEFTHTIKNGLSKNNKKWGIIGMKKIVASILCIVSMGTGMVLASNFLGNLWSNNGIKTALDYGYVQNMEMDYNVQNDLGIKLDSIILDDSNIGIVFNYKIPSDLKDIDRVTLTDITIKDENGNVIFEDGNKNDLCTGYTEEFASENGLIKQALLLNNLNHTYPKSDTLYISFSKVSIFRKQKNIRTITGNWNFCINVSDKFTNGEKIKYAPSQSENMEVTYAELTPTGLDIEIRFNAPINAEKLGGNIKLQDNEGNEYFPDGFVAENELTTPIIKTCFPITTYNAYGNLKLIIKTNKEIIIDLNKVE